MKTIKKLLYAILYISYIMVCINNACVTANETNQYEPITPNGVIIDYQSISTDLTSTIVNEYIIDESKYIKNGAIKLDNPTNKYNSHSYAWYNQNTSLNKYIISNTEAIKYINDGSYKESFGNENDILCYWRIRLEYADDTKTTLTKGEVYLAHSAIIKSIDGEFNIEDLTTLKNVTLISKWGNGGVYEHRGDNTPYYYDSIHGNTSIDQLHFDSVENNNIDDALFYIKAYSPNIDATKSIAQNDSSITFSKQIQEKGFALYKINTLNPGSYHIRTSSVNHLVNIKLYNKNMNLIYDNESIDEDQNCYIDASLDKGIYYIHISYQNSQDTGVITTTINSNPNNKNGIVTDSIDCGSEVFLNVGQRNDNTITEGFTRYLYLDGNDVPSKSRLEYDWYSSDNKVATISEYGTVFAKDGTGNPKITITAVYKKNRKYVYTIQLTILKEIRSYEEAPINIYEEMSISYGKNQLIELPTYAPYNYNQYYIWTSSDSNIVSVSSFGTLSSLSYGEVTVTGIYNYNKRVKIIIHVKIE